MGCFKVDYNHRFFYKYYIQNSKEYKVLKFFYNEENLDKRWAMERLMEVVLLFASEEERRAFEKHVMENFTLLQEQLHNSKSFSHVDMGNQEITKTYQERLRLGEILKIWLNDWQKYRKSEELIEI